MDITSQPVVIATIISLLASFIFTQIIARVIDHNYDKNYRELERNLQLKKLLEGNENESLNELVRVQLNSYLLIKMSGVKKTRKHRLMLFLLGLVTVSSLIISITKFIEMELTLAIVTLTVSMFLGTFYFNRRKVWFRSSYIGNTKYKAVLLGGKYDSGYTMIDIKKNNDDSTFSTLDFPFVYIKDAITGTVYGYKRMKSTGSISVTPNEPNSLETEYIFQGIVAKESQIVFGKDPVIQSIQVNLPDYFIPAMEEITVVSMKPLKGMFSLVAKVFKYFAKKSELRKALAETGAVEIIPTTALPIVKPFGNTSTDTKQQNIIPKIVNTDNPMTTDMDIIPTAS